MIKTPERKAFLKARKARKQLRKKQIAQLGILIKPVRKPSRKSRPSFYQAAEWKRVRYEILCEQKSICQICGASPVDGAVMNVDHMYPIHTHPHLALVKSNLRVLCASCNWGKGERQPTQFEQEFAPPWDRFDKF